MFRHYLKIIYGQKRLRIQVSLKQVCIENFVPVEQSNTLMS